MYELTGEQKSFIMSEENTVLCACPGSGKTYIVARKVHKYLEKWRKSHQGIAVLSFTNVASEEIANQVELITKNYRKISYPHFIGTVDSFINTFIVLQYGYLFNDNRVRPQIALNNIWKYPFKFWRSECHRNGCINSIEDFYYGIDGKLYKNNSEVTCTPNKKQNEPPCAQYKKFM
jgi:superfamily I DNA/RNA helicase